MSVNNQELMKSINLLLNRQQEFVDFFYNRVFEVAPSVKEFFEGISLVDQKKALLNGLQGILVNLNNDAVLIPKLEELGVRHVAYRVVPEHYPAVKSALMDSLRHVLGDELTETLEMEWVNILTFITKHMQSGAEGINQNYPVKERGRT